MRIIPNGSLVKFNRAIPRNWKTFQRHGGATVGSGDTGVVLSHEAADLEGGAMIVVYHVLASTGVTRTWEDEIVLVQ